MAIENEVSNGAYETRRSRISKYVTMHFDMIKTEMQADSRPYLTHAMTLARISKPGQTELLAELRANPNLYLASNPEPLIVAIMVYAN